MDRPDESLFEETKMSFGDHIEELRIRLFKAVIGVVIGFLLGLYFANSVVNLLQKPLRVAISEFKARVTREKANEVDIFVDQERDERDQPYEIKKVRLRRVELAANSIGPHTLSEAYPFRFNREEFRQKKRMRELLVAMTEPEADPLRLAIWERLTPEQQELLLELKEQTQFANGQYDAVAEIFNGLVDSDELFLREEFQAKEELLPNYARRDDFPEVGKRQHLLAVVYSPNLPVPGSETIELTMLIPATNETIATAIQGPFMIWLKTGFIVGLIISAPWVFYQIWAFVAAGLYPHEKRYVHIYLPISLILFVSGALFAFYVVFQYVLDFLFQFNAAMGVSPDPRVNEYIGFVLILPLGFGIAFQLPIVMVFLNRFGLVSIEAFLSKWRIAVLVISIASMVLTPQDPISMLLMAIPLTLLYFVGILMCKFMPKGRNIFGETEGYDPA